jgi:hypothetical protein
MAHEISTDDNGRTVWSFGPTGQLEHVSDEASSTEQVAKVVEAEEKPKAQRMTASTKAVGQKDGD